MIEPTDEMRRNAYTDARIWADRHGHAQPDDRLVDVVIHAVLELVERDYVVRPRTVIGMRPEMLSDRLGYPSSVGDEDWRRIQGGTS